MSFQSTLKKGIQTLCDAYDPTVICIAGSTGKSSLAGALISILEERYHILHIDSFDQKTQSLVSYFYPFDVPDESVWFRGWKFKKMLQQFLAAKTPYPNIILIEMLPSQIPEVLEWIRPDIAILLNGEHLFSESDHGKDISSIQLSQLIFAVTSYGLALLNTDDSRISPLTEHIRRDIPLVSFGIEESVDVRFVSSVGVQVGLKGTLFENERTFPLLAPHLMGKYGVQTLLAAWIVGRYLRIMPEMIQKKIQHYKNPPHRQQFITGKKRSGIIDASWDMNPDSVRENIALLKSLHTESRKIALFGDFDADFDASIYAQFGQYVAESRIDMIFFIGEHMKEAYTSFEHSRFEYVRIAFWYSTWQEALTKIPQKITNQDLILVTGGHKMELWNLVKEL